MIAREEREGPIRTKPICIVCDVEITPANDSREHIIQNAIGGVRKASGVLCKACNSSAGLTWDAEAARQLQFLTLHLGVSRDRDGGRAGEFRTISGRTVRKHPDGRLSFPNEKPVISTSGNGVNIQVRTTTRAQAEKTLKGLKRKYPKLDVAAALESIDESETYLSEPIAGQLNFGGELSGRSVVKSALTFAVAEGVEARTCNLALAYLRDPAGAPCFGYYFRRDLVLDRPADRIFHCVAVMGDAVSRKLIAYVEFFGIYRMVVGLSDVYDGVSFQSCYAIDPTGGTELTLKVDLEFSEEELRFALANEDQSLTKQLEAANFFMAFAQRRSFEREQRRVAGRAYTEAISALGLVPGQDMTPDIALRLSEEVTKRLLPFLQHRVGTQRRN